MHNDRGVVGVWDEGAEAAELDSWSNGEDAIVFGGSELLELGAGF